ncbi:MAG: cytochrome b/b6 domain-containing protein [Gammaproteobacteria bacterium]|nr:cytochrome b/b6 domain-containing protein [Gammaproteobacteria bacterium]
MTSSSREIPVWDIFVRLFHWSVVTLFLLDFWVLEEHSSLHAWAGYIIGLLVLMRFMWGFWGSRNARFSSFFPTPGRIREHLAAMRDGHVDPEAGHNPLGGMMILFLLLMLSVTTMSGWMLTWDLFWGEEWVEELHEIAANITMLAVLAHVSAVVIMGRLLGISLIRPMLTGKRSV